MRDIHVARNLADAYMIRDVLQGEGIPAVIRNEHLVGAAGSVPVSEAMPTVAVSDTDADRARFMVAEYLRDDDAAGALGQMEHDDPGSPSAGAQDAMADLHHAAAGLARGPVRGDLVDLVARMSPSVTATPPPFGVPLETWELVGRLTAALVDQAATGDEAAILQSAAELRDALRPYVA